MPCLDEAETIAICVNKARDFLQRSRIDGEVLVADNGSSDGSADLALAAGARVVRIDRKGYGNALIGGIGAARGRFVIMADADDSYDFSRLDALIETLRCGNMMVIGNRFRGNSSLAPCRCCIGILAIPCSASWAGCFRLRHRRLSLRTSRRRGVRPHCGSACTPPEWSSRVK